MIKIGITGSYGKTSTAEILYQYLLFLNKKVALYCTNGIFKNGETAIKNFFTTSYPKYKMEKDIVKLEEEGYEYVIIEVKGELFMVDPSYVSLDIIGLTNFDSELVNNFEESVALYRMCKQKALDQSKVSLIPDNLVNKFTNYTGTWSNYDILNLNPVVIKVDNTEVVTDLIGVHHVYNISLAIHILKELNIFEINSFREFASNINIRGRYVKYIVEGHDIILDTGWVGFEHILPVLKQIYGNDMKFNLVFVPISYNNDTDTTKLYRERSKDALSQAELILVNATQDEKLIRDKYLNSDYPLNKMQSDKDMHVCFQRAFETLEDNAILFIMARTKFREYKHIIEELV